MTAEPTLAVGESRVFDPYRSPLVSATDDMAGNPHSLVDGCDPYEGRWASMTLWCPWDDRGHWAVTPTRHRSHPPWWPSSRFIDQPADYWRDDWK